MVLINIHTNSYHHHVHQVHQARKLASESSPNVSAHTGTSSPCRYSERECMHGNLFYGPKLYCFLRYSEILAYFFYSTLCIGQGCGIGGCGFLSARGGNFCVASESANWSLFGAWRWCQLGARRLPAGQRLSRVREVPLYYTTVIWSILVLRRLTPNFLQTMNKINTENKPDCKVEHWHLSGADLGGLFYCSKILKSPPFCPVNIEKWVWLCKWIMGSGHIFPKRTPLLRVLDLPLPSAW
jgi:hypothetical protein